MCMFQRRHLSVTKELPYYSPYGTDILSQNYWALYSIAYIEGTNSYSLVEKEYKITSLTSLTKNIFPSTLKMNNRVKLGIWENFQHILFGYVHYINLAEKIVNLFIVFIEFEWAGLCLIH